MNRTIISSLCLMGTVLTAGCDRQAEGQVVAVVNGDEITQQELNAELGNASLAEGDQAEQARNAALSNIIDRRLLAGVARSEGIDTTPEYIVRRRQMEDTLLVQMLSQNAARDVKQPTPAQIDQFISENPQMFSERTAFAVDQLGFAKPTRDEYLKMLEDAKTMQEVVSGLNRLGIKFQRRNVQIDSASLSPDLFKQVMAVGKREPIVIPNGPTVTVSQILETKAVPINGDEARPVATQALQQKSIRSSLEDELKKAKDEAGIDYQPGFGPVEKPTTKPNGLTGQPATGKKLPGS